MKFVASALWAPPSAAFAPTANVVNETELFAVHCAAPHGRGLEQASEHLGHVEPVPRGDPAEDLFIVSARRATSNETTVGDALLVAKSRAALAQV
ncbi:MAG TPA: hypothetical protein VIK01_00065 [Polyangiaceae bacterium]